MLVNNVFSLLCFPLLMSVVRCSTLSRQRRQFVFPDEEELCSNRFTEEGTCKNVLDCRILLQKNDYNLLKESICGFEGITPKVCCPKSSHVISSTQAPPETTTTERPPKQIPPNLPEVCGIHNTTTTRIIGGREAPIGAWPWMTAVYIKQGGIRSVQCGGALVTNRHVITASHCVVNSAGTDVMPADVFSVRLGEHNLYSTDDDSNPIDFAVTSVKHHEHFVLATYLNDIAILTLNDTVTFTDRIRPICLPYRKLRYDDLAMRKPFITGWGTTAFNGPSSAVLREVQLPIWEHEACRQAYEKDLNITNVYMCAGFADGGKDACQGDSGGPMMLPVKTGEFYLIGIVSFGKKCALPGFPGVYTKVTEFLDWIAEHMV
ncbi:proclotting enzyme [Tachypleus tridentatus]|uniref:Proclotting enzyme n=1 Tax=Tachypleus tridentatus TaxID=6853 RepID=PCE_TACTR|nr:RecName: Full=Proclotting enzyme; Contains: RecName: Full=Proclotting enzyme light chain; Contains: RecName: Full=Proclotting enzyme heavy chain; Flags: Precursor [Tachypleus tridentatus]AAA30094.1 proclotting enzyme [Tachypleus tridentatus]